MSYGLILIEVCDANLACSSELFTLEEEYPQVSVLANECMSHCELCRTSPYVFLNGEIIAAPTLNELIQRIREEVATLVSNL